ncbi:hypothetical protein OC70_08940 [Micrococcus luteus]|nr:hypothetical protein OC70_08940 [Micrococcus luteus]MCT1871458.1 hypothetical protein [Micrococcus luteus]MCV7744540.1 hypothetical protein [Micrococcus luteus]
MFGPDILARTMSEPADPTKYGIRWQYHSRSDRHGKVASWGVAFDLLRSSSVMRQHARDGKIVLGVNLKLSDFETKKSKVLDLVIARPGGAATSARGESLVSLAQRYNMNLSGEEMGELTSLPDIPVAPVGSVLVALEAKATMTAHVKSLPRLHDELTSSHISVHGESQTALAIGYAQVNVADVFVSSNPANVERIHLGQEPVVTSHKQPGDCQRVLDTLNTLRTRSSSIGIGFDAIGVTVLDLRNDDSPVKVVHSRPAPQPGDAFHYDSMIMRMATRYDTQFSGI